MSEVTEIVELPVRLELCSGGKHGLIHSGNVTSGHLFGKDQARQTLQLADASDLLSAEERARLLTEIAYSTLPDIQPGGTRLFECEVCQAAVVTTDANVSPWFKSKQKGLGVIAAGAKRGLVTAEDRERLERSVGDSSLPTSSVFDVFPFDIPFKN